MKKNELFNFEKISDYTGHVKTDYNKIEKFDINKKFNTLLSIPATTHFPENNKKHD